MTKPIVERIKKPSYWYADQLPHFAVGLTIAGGVSAPLAFFSPLSPALSVWIGIAASIYAGWIRELIQNWGDEPSAGSVEDTNIDMMVWGLGSLTGSTFAMFA